MEKLTEIKKTILLDERGMIRPGLMSMNDYARILYAKSEDEIEQVINQIMESKQDGNQTVILEEEE